MDTLNQEFRAIMQDLMQKRVNTRRDLHIMCNAEQHRHKPDRTIYWIGAIDLQRSEWRDGPCSVYFYDRDQQLVQDKSSTCAGENAEHGVIYYDLKNIHKELEAHREVGFELMHYLIKEVVWQDGKQTVHIVRMPDMQSSYPALESPLNQEGEKWAVRLYNAALTNREACEKILIHENGKYQATA
jgi:hypothetical protein